MSPCSSAASLGVVAISYNEERDLPGFLEHLLPWVDEIVIVDDCSTDRTQEIIKKAGVKVRLVENKMSDSGGFAEQRNIGIEACRANWILHMDIDERVPPELAEEIFDAISDTDLNGFRYRRLNFFTHRPMKAGGWASWNNPQLARRGKHKFINRLHERCLIQGEPGSVGQLTAQMWHLNDESYHERMSKSFSYSRIEAQKLLERERKIFWPEIAIRPFVEFIKKYLIKRGFLDGVPGLIAAIHSADAVFRAYTLAWDEQNRIPREKLEEEIQSQWKHRNSSILPADNARELND